jgi:hypothetical protein
MFLKRVVKELEDDKDLAAAVGACESNVTKTTRRSLKRASIEQLHDEEMRISKENLTIGEITAWKEALASGG